MKGERMTTGEKTLNYFPSSLSLLSLLLPLHSCIYVAKNLPESHLRSPSSFYGFELFYANSFWLYLQWIHFTFIRNGNVMFDSSISVTKETFIGFDTALWISQSSLATLYRILYYFDPPSRPLLFTYNSWFILAENSNVGVFSGFIICDDTDELSYGKHLHYFISKYDCIIWYC